MSLSVMSMNLRVATARDGQNAWGCRKETVAKSIRHLCPDVFGIQEGTYSMLLDLEKHLPGYCWIGCGREGGLEGEFNSAFFKIDLLQPVWAGHFWLSETPDVPGSSYPGAGCPRMCTWVQFRLRCSGREFLFCSTHLDHRSAPARKLGAELICRHVEKHRKANPCPVILVGDMNEGPAGEALRTLRVGFSDAGEWLCSNGGEVGATYHGFEGTTTGHPIDFVLYSGWEVQDFRVFTDKVDGRYPSDHYPVLATLAFT